MQNTLPGGRGLLDKSSFMTQVVSHYDRNTSGWFLHGVLLSFYTGESAARKLV